MFHDNMEDMEDMLVSSEHFTLAFQGSRHKFGMGVQYVGQHGRFHIQRSGTATVAELPPVTNSGLGV